MKMDALIVDVNGRFTIHATDNTDYQLIFKDGMISVENELGHCVCEFFTEDIPAVDRICENCEHCKQRIIDENLYWKDVQSGGTHNLCVANDEWFDVKLTDYCSRFERKIKR